ncbi:hypothetical protein PS627_03903 [Pseudomonas fluorescens]|uniref:hypothetical protein n=1 Tax=Pseudomonas fluorescens TaxID=294 RepID=UPI0012569309|nr:hypothetical protein [Pseudomonas fluorescens]CAG8870195.1 hypothetical protein PS627_03903 [Pseudomonas fluorescens]VVP80218.1 hypothetical protein PS910_01883 [Pseudomonas fluorescens]
MEEVDPLTKERLREWQVRRLAIKDQMQDHPEKTLELSRILDLMDDEHEQILHEAKRQSANSSAQPLANNGVNLQLTAAAATPQDLRKLLELALYELDGLLEQPDTPGARRMSGTLGEYRFELALDAEPVTPVRLHAPGTP